MTIPVSTETKILRALAQRLENAGIGVYATPGAVVPVGTAATPTIVIGKLPPASGVTIALQDYPVEDSPGLADAIIGIQAWVRGDPNPDTARDIESAVFGQLGALAGVAVGDTWIDQMYRQSTATVGPDSLNNFERSSNYYLHFNRPGVAE